MSLLRALVVDDEHLARRGLVMRLAGIEGIEVVGECKNGEEALAAIQNDAPDVMFLDIQMPGLTGFDVVQRLQADTMPSIVFVTAFDAYAFDAFRVNAVDYLLKPLEEDRLRESVARVRNLHAARDAAAEKAQLLELVVSLGGAAAGGEGGPPSLDTPGFLPIKDDGEIHFVPLDLIEWVDAAGDYMCVHADNETHILRSTMKELLRRLSDARFLRIHRSTVVNQNFIARVQPHPSGDYGITLHNGTQLKVSRGQRDTIKALISR